MGHSGWVLGGKGSGGTFSGWTGVPFHVRGESCGQVCSCLMSCDLTRFRLPPEGTELALKGPSSAGL